MLLQRRAWLYGLALILGVALIAPVRAGEVDKFLPDDSEVVMTINVKQIIDSPLFKKYGLDSAKQLIKDNDEIGDVLKDLGFDPLKDVDRILIGSAGGDDVEKVLYIVHGHFDLDKFKAKGEDAAKTNAQHLKIHKRASGPVIYEVLHPQLDNNLFVALVDKNTMLISPGKDYVIDGLKKIDKKEATVKSKEVRTLIERMDAKQSVSIAMIGSAAAKSKELADLIPKQTLENLDAVGGGVTIGDDIKMEFVVAAKTADSAKAMGAKINESLNTALLFLGVLVETKKDLAPALDILKSIKATAKDKTVTLKGEVTTEQLEQLSKAIRGLVGQ